MKVLGIRCSNSDYAYCIISGIRMAPAVEATRRVSLPEGYNEAESLKWLRQEMQNIFGSHRFDQVGIKKAETNARRTNALDARIRNEAIVSLVAAESGCLRVAWKVKSTIAKDLGLKGKGKYLESRLDTSPIIGFDAYPREIKEAVLVGWSCM